MLGFAYFVVITALSTVLQEHLDDAVRGRVMALWIMSFGGTVPVGVAVGGWLISGLGMSITGVMLLGVADRARPGLVLRPRRRRRPWALRIIGAGTGLNRIKRAAARAESLPEAAEGSLWCDAPVSLVS